MSTHLSTFNIHAESENGLAGKVAAKTFGVEVNAAKRAPLGNIGNQHFSANVGGKDAVKTAKPSLSLRTTVTDASRAARVKRTRKGSTTQQITKRTVMVHEDALGMDFEEAAAQAAAQAEAIAAASAAANVQAAKFQLPPGVEDIDVEDSENPLLVAEYVNDIYGYMRELELKTMVSEGYLSTQPDINPKMRSILVDWLVDVHLRFELLQETLYLTISVMDRYLSQVQVARNRLQLVAVTAMLIASKYEEMYAPEVRDFVYMCENAYTRDDILKMEQHMLRVLDFSLGQPLALHFLRRNSKAGKSDACIHTLAKYLMELTLGSHQMLKYTPSKISAAGLFLSRTIVGEAVVWDATLQHYSGYSADELTGCVQEIAQLLMEARTSDTVAVKNKYARSKFMKISSLPEVENFTL